MFSGSGPVNVARTLAVSPANSGATGRRRPGKLQFMAQARPSSFFALAHGTRGLVAWRSIACQAVKRRSNSTVKLGAAVLFSGPPGVGPKPRRGEGGSQVAGFRERSVDSFQFRCWQRTVKQRAERRK